MNPPYDTPRPRPTFASCQEYGERFADLAFWQSTVRAICRRHHLFCDVVHMGVPGTYPTFLVDDQWVVKLFGEWFEGGASHAVEREVYALLETQPSFLAPQLVAVGDLYTDGEGWPWPYLVSQQLPGRSLGQERYLVAEDDMMSIALATGRVLRQLHTTPMNGATALAPTWEHFTAFIADRRRHCLADQRAWGRVAARSARPDCRLPAARRCTV